MRDLTNNMKNLTFEMLVTALQNLRASHKTLPKPVEILAEAKKYAQALNLDDSPPQNDQYIQALDHIMVEIASNKGLSGQEKYTMMRDISQRRCWYERNEKRCMAQDCLSRGIQIRDGYWVCQSHG